MLDELKSFDDIAEKHSEKNKTKNAMAKIRVKKEQQLSTAFSDAKYAVLDAAEAFELSVTDIDADTGAALKSWEVAVKKQDYAKKVYDKLFPQGE